MASLSPLAPPMSTEQFDALVAAASPEALRRPLRIVFGAEQAYWERDLQSGEMWYSPRFFQVLGLPATQQRELINARSYPDDRAQVEAAYASALAKGDVFSYDVRYRDVDDRYRWARAFGRVWLDQRDRRPLRLIRTMIDLHAECHARLTADASARRNERARCGNGSALRAHRRRR